jgi:hypothetical protein
MDNTEIGFKQIKDALSDEKSKIAETLNISEEELDILNANFNYLAKYVHLTQPDTEIKHDAVDLLKATSQALCVFFICEEHDIDPVSLIGKFIMNTLIYRSEMSQAANND